MSEYYGRTLGEAISKSLDTKTVNSEKPAFLEQKRRFELIAPNERWSRWIVVWGQLGALDKLRRGQKWAVEISLLSRLDFYVPIKIQIKGGERLYEGYDHGPHKVFVPRKTTTGIKFRLQAEGTNPRVVAKVRAFKTL